MPDPSIDPLARFKVLDRVRAELPFGIRRHVDMMLRGVYDVDDHEANSGYWECVLLRTLNIEQLIRVLWFYRNK
jgi:hypothetical protein